MDWRDRPHLEASATRIVLVTDPLQPVSFCDERFDAVVEWRFVCPGRKKHEKHACTWKTGRGVGWNVWITTMGLLAAGLAWRMMGGWCSWNRAPEDPDRRSCWCWHSLCLCLRQSLPSWVRRCGCKLTTASDSSGSSKSTRRIGLFLPLGAMPQNPAASVPVYAVFFQASHFDDFLFRFDVFFTKFQLGRYLTNRLPHLGSPVSAR